MLKIMAMLLFTVSGCATPSSQIADLTNLKPEQRGYTGNVQVNLNGKTNSDLTCDLFVNSDINPVFRISPDGNFTFASIKKKLAFSRIACIYSVKNKKHWIQHSIDLPRIAQPTDPKQILDLGSIDMVWTVDDREFDEDPTSVFGTKDKMRDIGKLEVKPPQATPPSPQI